MLLGCFVVLGFGEEYCWKGDSRRCLGVMGMERKLQVLLGDISGTRMGDI